MCPEPSEGQALNPAARLHARTVTPCAALGWGGADAHSSSETCSEPTDERGGLRTLGRSFVNQKVLSLVSVSARSHQELRAPAPQRADV